MKKPTLVLAIAIASTTAQAQVVNQNFFGSIDSLKVRVDDAAFAEDVISGILAIDYAVNLTYNAGTNTVLGLDVTLDGVLNTAGASNIPTFMQQEWTFTNAVYSMDASKVTENDVGFAPDFSQLTGAIEINGGVFATQPVTSASTLQSGNAVCQGNSCGNFSANQLMGSLTFDFILDPGNDFAEISHALGIALSSTTGEFVYELTTIPAMSPIPVPAAAWLFGSAMVGLAGFKRSRG